MDTRARLSDLALEFQRNSVVKSGGRTSASIFEMTPGYGYRILYRPNTTTAPWWECQFGVVIGRTRAQAIRWLLLQRRAFPLKETQPKPLQT